MLSVVLISTSLSRVTLPCKYPISILKVEPEIVTVLCAIVSLESLDDFLIFWRKIFFFVYLLFLTQLLMKQPARLYFILIMSSLLDRLPKWMAGGTKQGLYSISGVRRSKWL